MTYALLQDARGSTGLGARAQAVISAQARVADLTVELNHATTAYQATVAAYEQEKRRIALESGDPS